MAMLDNQAFLISHIRNSFITSDDTGMCEEIIDCNHVFDRWCPPDLQIQPSTTTNMEIPECASDDGSVISDTELSNSFDLMPDMDMAGHRRRSYTAQRLDKLKREREQRSKIHHVQWKDIPAAKEPSELMTTVFEKKAVSGLSASYKKSALSVQLAEVDAMPNNPFAEFAKFDGKSSSGVAVKSLAIFLTMAKNADRPYPMTVVAVSTAKIAQVIGLICWQYTKENRQPPLKNTIEYYALHIAEDDGEVDMDFPALDINEPISKFGFAKLALVERDAPMKRGNSSMVITINMPNRGFARIPIEDDSILMREILQRVLERRHLDNTVLQYRLEKQREPGVVVELDKPLTAMTTLEFCLVRENSMRGDLQTAEEGAESGDLTDMTYSLCSHQYQSYHVLLLQKLSRNIDVQLGISGEKIEIDPVQVKQTLFKHKATTHDIDTIVACQLLSKERFSFNQARNQGKSTFRLVYQNALSHDYQHHDFEASTHVCAEIVKKVNNIMELRSSPKKQEYLAYKERKGSVSKSNSFKNATSKLKRRTTTLGSFKSFTRQSSQY